MFLWECWFLEIRNDIKKKYNIDNPIFTIAGKDLEFSLIIKWIEETFDLNFYWLFYKKINKQKFELTFFAPNSQTNICNKLINNFLDSLSKIDKKKLFTLSYPLEKAEITSEEIMKYYTSIVVGETEYSEEEIKKELLYLFLNGKSKISFFKDPTGTNDHVIHHFFVCHDSLPNMLKNGYLELEYFD